MSGKKSIIKTMVLVILLGLFFVALGVALYIPAAAEAELSSAYAENDKAIQIANAIGFIPAFFVLGIGGIIILCAVVSAIRKLSMFREENKVYGVIVDVYENPNIVIDHKHPKKAICEITDPVTGAVRRVESANSKMELFDMVGMNVPIYVNPKKPQKVFVDLENAAGEIKLAEGQQRVRDLRNL